MGVLGHTPGSSDLPPWVLQPCSVSQSVPFRLTFRLDPQIPSSIPILPRCIHPVLSVPPIHLGPRVPHRLAALYLVPLPGSTPSFHHLLGAHLFSSVPARTFPQSPPNSISSLGLPRLEEFGRAQQEATPTTGEMQETDSDPKWIAYLSCPFPGHQLRPQGPGPGPGLPAGAGTMGPCCRLMEGLEEERWG